MPEILSITKMTEKMRAFEKMLLKIVEELEGTSNITKIYYTKIRKKVGILFQQAGKEYSNWAAASHGEDYRESARHQIRAIKRLKFNPRTRVHYNKFINGKLQAQSIESVISRSQAYVTLGLSAGQKTMNQLISATHALAKQIDNLSRHGDFNIIKSSIGKFKREQAEIIKRLRGEKFITIINKNGKPMHYTLTAYTELVARTSTIFAETTATLDLAREYDNDLVQVSAHNTRTPYDATFEGKVFSLSGKSDMFPPATDLPPFHPNCMHSISVFFAEAQKEKTLKELSDFSNDRVSTHPTIKSHVPIEEREF